MNHLIQCDGVIFLLKFRIHSVISAHLCRLNRKTIRIGAGIVWAVGAFSILLTLLLGGNFRIYAYLHKPLFAPPRVLLSLFWTVFLLLAGGAAGAVYGSQRCREEDKYRGLFLFVIMLTFLEIWCPLFFAAGAYFLALADIAILLLLSGFTARYFFLALKPAGWAMVLFTLWLLYAFILNFAILLLN